MEVKKSWMVESFPFAGSVLTAITGAVIQTLSKAAMSKGMSCYVFIVYSSLPAPFLHLPEVDSSSILDTYVFEFEFWKTSRTPITFSLLCKLFLLSLIAVTVSQICLFTGIDYSTPALGSVIGQSGPAFTFLLAVIFRMEILDLKKLTGQIKVSGTLLLICGALVAVLYKGPALLTATKTDDELWVIGGIFLTIATLSQSVNFILQAAILKEDSSEVTLVFFLCGFATIQCGIVSLIMERDINAWILTPDVELISVITAGILGVVTFSIFAWCIKKKGPIFVAIFGPLSIPINALLGAIFLGDILHVGSVVGAIVIVVGFYGVLWAQSKENYGPDQVTKTDAPQSSSQTITPLLESHALV